jgi:aryl-alcohol dehydrogenase-like predicted oxidoreductase
VDGDRSSEHMLGVALKGRRGEAVIASKFGLHKGEDTAVYGAVAVAQAIEESLAALQTDYLDLLQVHWPGNIGYQVFIRPLHVIKLFSCEPLFFLIEVL